MIGQSRNPCCRMRSPCSVTRVAIDTSKPASAEARASSRRWDQKYQSSVMRYSSRGRSLIRSQPGLEHQNIPERILPVSPSGEMLGPFLPYRIRMEVPFFLQGALVKQFLCPFPQRSPEPIINWNAKPHFGSFDEFLWHIAVQDLSKKPLALPLTLDLHGQRNPPAKFDQTMIQERHAGFETHRHAGTIHLRQDIVAKVRDEIEIHHA